MIYLETSCLLKLLFTKPESEAVRSAVDRLHLAAMEELRINRLMTLDSVQAEAAAELNYDVFLPGQKTR